VEQLPQLVEPTQAALRDEADRVRFYAQMLRHRFRDPVTADQLQAVAVDLERQAAALSAQPQRRYM
jgi:mannitol-1-phosphate/altronate dehydrogenase